MKKFILALLISIISLLTFSIITSSIVAYLQYGKDIKINMYLLQAISIILFLISGLIFGLINKKQGLFGALAFILVYVIFVFIFNILSKPENIQTYYFLFIIGKCLFYSLGCVVGVNIRRH